MQFIPAQYVARVAMEFTHYNEFACNVYHVQYVSTWDIATMGGLLATFESWWKDHKSLISKDTILHNITGRDMTIQAGTNVLLPVTSANVGTNAEDGHSSNVTVAVKWGTGLAGRSYRGRTYHIGLPLMTTSGNTLLAQTIADLEDMYNDLITALEDFSANALLCVVSNYHDNAPRTNAVVTPITSVSVDATLDNQRRRLPGRGM